MLRADGRHWFGSAGPLHGGSRRHDPYDVTAATRSGRRPSLDGPGHARQPRDELAATLVGDPRTAAVAGAWGRPTAGCALLDGPLGRPAARHHLVTEARWVPATASVAPRGPAAAGRRRRGPAGGRRPRSSRSATSPGRDGPHEDARASRGPVARRRPPLPRRAARRAGRRCSASRPGCPATARSPGARSSGARWPTRTTGWPGWSRTPSSTRCRPRSGRADPAADALTLFAGLTVAPGRASRIQTLGCASWAKRSQHRSSPARTARGTARRCVGASTCSPGCCGSRAFDADDPMTGLEIELNLVDEVGDPALKNAEALEADRRPRLPDRAGPVQPRDQRAAQAAPRPRASPTYEETCGPASTTPSPRPPRSARTW